MILSRSALAVVLAASLASGVAGSFKAGSVLVSRIGDSSTAPSNNGSKAAILEFDADGNVLQTVSISSGDGGLVLQADSGGRIALSRDRKDLAIAGYIPPFSGSGPLGGRSELEAKRGYARISTGGSVSDIQSVPGLGGRSADSVVTSDNKAWITGADYLAYWNDSETKFIFRDNGFDTIYPRNVRTFNGRLCVIANRFLGAGFLGTYNGFPTNADASINVLFDVTNPQDFSVSPDGDTIYVATASGAVDVHKRDGGGWSRKYSLTGVSQILAVAVDFGGSRPVVYAVSPTKVYRALDMGKGDAMKEIAKSEGQAQFRGIDVIPSPPAAKPVIHLGVARRFTTTSKQVRIFGAASDKDGIRAVRYRKGTKGKDKLASGRENWRFTAPRLRTGINRFFIRAIDKTGARSDRVKVVVIKK
jgi:hypothetical protein